MSTAILILFTFAFVFSFIVYSANIWLKSFKNIFIKAFGVSISIFALFLWFIITASLFIDIGNSYLFKYLPALIIISQVILAIPSIIDTQKLEQKEI